jgi:hypothetical protein
MAPSPQKKKKVATFSATTHDYGEYLSCDEARVHLKRFLSAAPPFSDDPDRFRADTHVHEAATARTLGDDITEWAVAAADDESPSAGWSAPSAFASGATLETRAETDEASRTPGCAVFRIRARVEAPPAAVLPLVCTAQALGEMDETVLVLHVLAEFGNRTRLVYNVTRVGFPFQPRDFVDITCERETDDGRLVSAAVSVPDVAPTVDGIVRGQTLRWGVVLAPADDGAATDMTLLCSASLAGWMPRTLTNLMAGRVLAKGYVAKLKEAAEKGDKEQ